MAKKPAPRKPSQSAASPLPPWLQHDHCYELLPAEHQQAIREIIQPLYERFVLQPADHLERSTGSSVIYLLWTELLKQAELATTPYANESVDLLCRRMLLDDLYLVLAPKSRMSSLLIRLRQLNAKSQQPEPPVAFPPFPADIGQTAPLLPNTPVT